MLVRRCDQQQWRLSRWHAVRRRAADGTRLRMRRIHRVVAAGTVLAASWSLMGVGNIASASPAGGQLSILRSGFDTPFGVAVDGAGDVYIADANHNKVDRVSPSGRLSVIAGTGPAGRPTPGPATRSALHSPFGVAVDGAGDVYIADAGNNEIDKVSPGGVLSVIAGNGTAGPPRAGLAKRSELNTPFGVAVDGSGNVYIADANNAEVEKVSVAGTLSVFAGTGRQGKPRPGPANRSALEFPAGVAVDGLGTVYIADPVSCEVEKVSSRGILSIFAGTGAGSESAKCGTPTPGPATKSDLQGPYGVAVDRVGNVYIADTFYNEVDKVSGGILSVVAGTGTTGRPNPGPATRSNLDQPTGVAVDASGTMYVADSLNNEVEKVTPSEAPAVVGIATSGRGHVLVTAAGNVYTFGVRFRGSLRSVGVRLTSPVVGVAATSAGYVVATSAGNVYSFGIKFRGSPRSVRLTSPVVGVAATSAGYVLATSAGNVYTFGIKFRGSPRSVGVRLTSPVVGVAATSAGYVLATSAGNVYSFGIKFRGSPRSVRLTSPVVGVAAASTGYVLATSAGSVYTYGVQYRGSPRGSLRMPVAGLSATNGGYSITTTGGHTSTY